MVNRFDTIVNICFSVLSKGTFWGRLMRACSNLAVWEIRTKKKGEKNEKRKRKMGEQSRKTAREY